MKNNSDSDMLCFDLICGFSSYQRCFFILILFLSFMSTFVFTLNLLFSELFLQVKESKERAMSSLSPYRSAVSHDFTHDSNINSQQATDGGPSPFVSLLEFVSEVYQVR